MRATLHTASLMAALALTAPAAAAAQTADTLRARPYAEIGAVDGAPEYVFGNIRAVAEDRHRRIWVADRIGSTVRVYSPVGRFLREVGREGDGPGEYRWPVDIRFRGDTAWLRDSHRITVLVPRRSGDIPDSVRATVRLPGYGNTRPRAAGLDASGSYYYPYYLKLSDGSSTRHFYLRLNDGAWAADTLEVPQYPALTATFEAYYMINRGTGRMLYGLSAVPFAPVPGWDITPHGTVISGDGRSYELRESDRHGRVVRGFTRDAPLQRIPPEERRDSLAALRARIDAVPVPLSSVLGMPDDVRQQRLPETLPAFIDVHVATNGSVWVRRWPRSGRQESLFDVFTHDGRYAHTVVLPVTLSLATPPYITGQTIIGVVVDPATDVERVVAYRFDLR